MYYTHHPELIQQDVQCNTQNTTNINSNGHVLYKKTDNTTKSSLSVFNTIYNKTINIQKNYNCQCQCQYTTTNENSNINIGPMYILIDDRASNEDTIQNIDTKNKNIIDNKILPETNTLYTNDTDYNINCNIFSNNGEKYVIETKLPIMIQPKSSTYNLRKQFNTLIQWLRKYGTTFSKLDILEIDSVNRGIFATEDIKEDEILLHIPRNLIITSEVARSSPIGTAITNSGIQLRSKHTYIASYLLEELEKNTKSFWWPYLYLLPTSFSTIPMFFNEETLSLLHGSFLLKKICDRIDSLRREYYNICNAISNFSRFSYDEFVWIRMIVITRIFGIIVDGKKTDGMIPQADQQNHKIPRETKWTYDNTLKGFVVTSLNTIHKQCQIYDSYGRKCNSRFFLNYGFVMETNEDNETMIRVKLDDDDKEFARKLTYLNVCNTVSSKREYQIPAYIEDKKTEDLLRFLRLAACTSEEFHIYNKGNFFEPITYENERRSLITLYHACVSRILEFPTTIEQDIQLLYNNSTITKYSNDYNCIVLRKGEKEVLHWFLQFSICGLQRLNTHVSNFSLYSTYNFHPKYLYTDDTHPFYYNTSTCLIKYPYPVGNSDGLDKYFLQLENLMKPLEHLPNVVSRNNLAFKNSQRFLSQHTF